MSDRAGGLGGRDVWHATRSSRTTPFVVTGPANDVSSTSNDGVFRSLPGGLTGWLSSGRAGNFDLWFASRSQTTSPFTVSQSNLGAVNTSFDEFDPLPVRGGLGVYFGNTSSGSTDLYFSQRTTLGVPFGSPAPLTAINVPGDDADPALSPDELVLVFTSQRLSPQRDIFIATRPTITGTFSTPVLLGTISSSSDDHDPMFSSDGCELWFASNRSGDHDIYVSTVTP